MLTTIFTVIPIFCVIGAGYGVGRFDLLGAGASSTLNRYVVYLALPALLFEVMAKTKLVALWQPGFIAAFGIGAFGVFAATLAGRVWSGRPVADAAIDGLNAGYANAGFVGLPLCEAIFGRASLPFATIATVLTVCVLFGVALIIVESGLQSEARPHQVAFKVIGNLARNPLLIAPVFGLAWSAAGLTLGGPLETFVRLLAGSTTPCALVALGLFLAIRRDVPGAKAPPIAFTALKLVGQPALTGLAAIALGLPHALMAIAVVIAALPTGTGPFMVAEYYGREAVVTSKTILMTTALSAVTVTILICFLHIG